MKLPAVVTSSFLRTLPESERKRLGRAGITPEEANAMYQRGQEHELKGQALNILNRRGAWIFDQPMNKKTRGRRGVPDIIACYRSYFVGIELKAEAQRMTTEQAAEAARIRKAGGFFILAFKLEDILEELQRIDRIADGVEKP
jgi:hypothetical protein